MQANALPAQYRKLRKSLTRQAVDASHRAADKLKQSLAARTVAVFMSAGVKKGGVPREHQSVVPWKPTSRVGLAMRKNPVYNPSSGGWHTLVDTGELFRSIRGKVKKSALSAMLKVGTKNPKGGKHQFGLRTVINGRKVRLPKRPFLYWNEGDRVIAKKAFVRELNR